MFHGMILLHSDTLHSFNCAIWRVVSNRLTRRSQTTPFTFKKRVYPSIRGKENFDEVKVLLAEGGKHQADILQVCMLVVCSYMSSADRLLVENHFIKSRSNNQLCINITLRSFKTIVLRTLQEDTDDSGFVESLQTFIEMVIDSTHNISHHQ